MRSSVMLMQATLQENLLPAETLQAFLQEWGQLLGGFR